jgi:hypothetical protein
VASKRLRFTKGSTLDCDFYNWLNGQVNLQLRPTFTTGAAVGPQNITRRQRSRSRLKAMVKPTFEYASARFLNQWVLREKRLHDCLQEPDGPAVREAIAYFGVARGFGRIKNAKRATYVAERLSFHGRWITPNVAADRVEALAADLQHKFKQNLLSAASKLLWLRHCAPFVLLDSRSVKGLKLLELKFDKRNYAAYATCWRKAFDNRRDVVAAAAGGLSKFQAFTAASQLQQALCGCVGKEFARFHLKSSVVGFLRTGNGGRV